MFRSILFFLLLVTNLMAASQTELAESYARIDQLSSTHAKSSLSERREVFNLARYHKVAALEKIHQYDPNGEIGFCFGRAMTVDLLARKKGLDSASIKKLFVIGDLRSGDNPEWRFHVTTLLKEESGNWSAIDPIMEPPLAPGGPLPMEGWMEIVEKTWDKNKRAHFYLVDGQTVIPDLREVPEPTKEVGNRVIEIKFDPKLYSGFSEKQVAGRTYFEVSPAAQATYFTTVYETPEEESFQFLGIRINGIAFDYRHYFEDLLEDLSRESSQ